VKDFTVIVPFFNGFQTIDRLLKTLPADLPVIIVDDHSDKPLVLNWPNVAVVRPEKKGYFTGAVNVGLQMTSTDVLILNQDVYFQNDHWQRTIENERDRYGLIGERIAGNHPAWPMGYIHGTFMFIRRDVIAKIGLMNETDYPLWGSTCEYQLRACRAGFEALPLVSIPGFVHTRDGNHGDGIKQVLREEPAKKPLFIRTPPMISVVITCYNYGRYLNDAVNSLIGGDTSLGKVPGQSFQSFEVIIVDDGSTDDSAKIGQALANPWKGIRFIQRQNGGSAAAANTGIEAAKGKYITVLDADDMMMPNRLESLYRLALLNPHSIVYDDMRVIANGKVGKTWEMPDYDFEEIIYKNGVHKGILFPKKAWQEAGGYPETMNKGREDWAFNIALGIKGWCGVHLRQPLYLYRQEGQSRTQRSAGKYMRPVFFEQIKSLYPGIYRGERPNMCCGQKSSPKGAKPSGGGVAMATKYLPGRDGMAILEYTGTNSGDMTWAGPVTKTNYLLGGGKKRGYVDSRDVPGMLEISEKGRKQFKVYNPPKLPPQIPTPAPVVEVKIPTYPVEIVAEIAEDVEAKGKNVFQGIDLSFPDPSELSVKEVSEIVAKSDLFQLEEMLRKERGDKNRKGAITAIQEAISGK
jgi:glycosyltransferase involved in cell wall biosynthesis